MQVFIIGDVLETAKCLDPRRLNKQIVECRQILSAINGISNGWKNHPCTIQYREFTVWLEWYASCLSFYKNGAIVFAEFASMKANEFKPSWHTRAYYDNMKRRLYTKDHIHYKQFAHLGESYENWYWVNNEWKIYKQN